MKNSQALCYNESLPKPSFARSGDISEVTPAPVPHQTKSCGNNVANQANNLLVIYILRMLKQNKIE